MQANNPASPLHSSSPPQAGLTNLDLKRKYLALLPPTQIIDLCLAFEAQAPVHLQTTLWPSDLSDAISKLQKPPEPQQKQQSPPPPESGYPPTPRPENSSTPAEDPPTNHGQAMSALTDTANEQDPSVLKSNGNGGPIDVDALSDSSFAPSPVINPAPSPALTPAPTSQAGTPSIQPAPTPTPTPLSLASSIPAATAPTPATHPHFPTHYTYSTAPAAYPHAPYYPMPPPGAYYHYPSNYYHYHHPGPTPTINPQPSVPSSFYPAPPPHAAPNPYGGTNGNGISADDLPSYEEMLVEALGNCDEGEGCAPKNLFTWMSMHYPLQTNFRPSASQALQKAHKRGRFGKNEAGKYFLRTNWEGGNTSRRTTRRPQTGQSTTAVPAQNIQPPLNPTPSRSSPFTTAPLVHQSGAQFAITVEPATTAHAAEEQIVEGSEAWVAAQNIIKAIGLLTMPPEENNSAARKDVAEGSSAVPVDEPPIPDLAISSVTAPPLDLISDAADGRSLLRSQLSLLAAQLESFMQEDEVDTGTPVVLPQPSAPATQTAVVPPIQPQDVTAPVLDDYPTEDEDEDMEEVTF